MKDIKQEDLEIELKIKVENPNFLTEWLNNNAEFIKEEKLEDHYLEQPKHPFRFVNDQGLMDALEWLRVRKSSKGSTFNFKRAIANKDQEVSHFEETETGIEDTDKMLKILMILGYEEICCYHKTRKVYHYKEFEFDLDLVDELGIFLEIEFQGQIENLQKGVPAIHNLLKEIGIHTYTIVNTGYPQIFWNGLEHYIIKKESN